MVFASCTGLQCRRIVTCFIHSFNNGSLLKIDNKTVCVLHVRVRLCLSRYITMYVCVYVCSDMCNCVCVIVCMYLCLYVWGQCVFNTMFVTSSSWGPLGNASVDNHGPGTKSHVC